MLVLFLCILLAPGTFTQQFIVVYSTGTSQLPLSFVVLPSHRISEKATSDHENMLQYAQAMTATPLSTRKAR
jgi:hypothetical protein